MGVAIFATFVAAIFVFGAPTQAQFSTEHKMQIQRIANELCAAAAEHPCQLSWGGKSKWFGTLEPSAPGRGKVGLDQVRQVLGTPPWQESAQSTGVVFKSKNYEVFYSSQSGAITITSLPGVAPQ